MKMVGSNIFKEENSNSYLPDKLILTSKEYPNSHLKIEYFLRNKPILYKRQREYKSGKVYNFWDEWGSKVQLDARDVKNFQLLEVGTSKVQKVVKSVFCLICGNIIDEVSEDFCVLHPLKDYKKVILEVSYKNKFYTECFENNNSNFVSMSNRHKYNELKIPKEYFVCVTYL